MPHFDMSEHQFQETLRRCGFRREGLEGFYTVVWKRDGTPHMGVSIKGNGSSRMDQLAHLVKARNRYLRDDAIVFDDGSTPRPGRNVHLTEPRQTRTNRHLVGWTLLVTVFVTSVFVLGVTVGLIVAEPH